MCCNYNSASYLKTFNMLKNETIVSCFPPQVSPPPLHHHHPRKHTPSGGHSPHPSSPPPLSASLNNNLNELDCLLQDLSSHKYPPPSGHSPISGRGDISSSPSPINVRATELGSSYSPVHRGKESPYAPPPLHTTVRGSPASPSPSHFQPSSNCKSFACLFFMVRDFVLPLYVISDKISPKYIRRK